MEIHPFCPRRCGRADSNCHARRAPPPQDGASTNFATSAGVNACKSKVNFLFSQVFFLLRHWLFVFIDKCLYNAIRQAHTGNDDLSQMAMLHEC